MTRRIPAETLGRIKDLVCDIDDACTNAEDAAADYENASDLPVNERGDARESASDDLLLALSELLSDAVKLKEQYSKLTG